MNPNTITLVQQSWSKVAIIAPQVGVLFYQNLFESDANLKPLFKGDMAEQGIKLTNMIGVAVNRLSDLDFLVPALEDMAVRHNGYGVKEEHYVTVGAALIKTLGQGLGDDFTDQVKAAWIEVYGVMSDVMIAASKQSELVSNV